MLGLPRGGDVGHAGDAAGCRGTSTARSRSPGAWRSRTTVRTRRSGPAGSTPATTTGRARRGLGVHVEYGQLGGGTNSCTECHGSDLGHADDAVAPEAQRGPELRAVPRRGDAQLARQRFDQPAGDPARSSTAAATPWSRRAAAPSVPAPARPPAATWAALRRTGGRHRANCGSCHGYPPSGGTSHLDANRTGYTNNDTTFLAAHGQCSICHGVAGNTTYPTVPTGFGTPLTRRPPAMCTSSGRCTVTAASRSTGPAAPTPPTPKTPITTRRRGRATTPGATPAPSSSSTSTSSHAG